MHDCIYILTASMSSHILVLSPDLIRAGVGFGSGTETSHILVSCQEVQCLVV